MKHAWPWLALFLLGAYHGVNPGMGWLFAVALGLQEKSRRAVARALVPIGLGHALSIALVLVWVGMAEFFFPRGIVSRAFAVALILFGLSRLWRERHPRWVGMRVGFNGLTLWSFLMATAHGAGLMLIPILLASPGVFAVGHAMPMAPMGHAPNVSARLLVVVAVHTLGLLLVAGLVAAVVYEKLGLAILRRAWINLDRIWALALVATGLVALVWL
jgi:hypothetical protein